MLFSGREAHWIGGVVQLGLNDNTDEEPSKMEGFRECVKFDNCLKWFYNDLTPLVYNTYNIIILQFIWNF